MKCVSYLNARFKVLNELGKCTVELGERVFNIVKSGSSYLITSDKRDNDLIIQIAEQLGMANKIVANEDEVQIEKVTPQGCRNLMVAYSHFCE